MSYEIIKTHYIGVYRINIYRDTNVQCPCTDCDMGAVIGYELFQQVFFTKHYHDENREDEEDYEWEYMHSCGGYEDVDELIQLVIDEYELKD